MEHEIAVKPHIAVSFNLHFLLKALHRLERGINGKTSRTVQDDFDMISSGAGIEHECAITCIDMARISGLI